MKIHTQIRQEVLALLQAKLPDVEYFYNGRPAFIDIEEQQLAIAVYLDEMSCRGISVCNEQWQAQLHIVIYLKSIEDAEDELDHWAERIRRAIYGNDGNFAHLDSISLSQYQYEQDQTQRTWFTATLVFDVEYPNELPTIGEV